MVTVTIRKVDSQNLFIVINYSIKVLLVLSILTTASESASQP